MIVLAEALWTSRTDIKIISIWITLKLLWCWYHLTSIDKPTSVIWFRALNSEFQSNLRAERHAEISSEGSSNWMQPILHFILALLESNCQLLIHEPRGLHVSRWHVTATEQFSLSQYRLICRAVPSRDTYRWLQTHKTQLLAAGCVMV